MNERSAGIEATSNFRERVNIRHLESRLARKVSFNDLVRSGRASPLKLNEPPFSCNRWVRKRKGHGGDRCRKSTGESVLRSSMTLTFWGSEGAASVLHRPTSQANSWGH